MSPQEATQAKTKAVEAEWEKMRPQHEVVKKECSALEGELAEVQADVVRSPKRIKMAVRDSQAAQRKVRAARVCGVHCRWRAN